MFRSISLLALSSLLLMGCEQQPQKTESMIRFEKAQKQQVQLVNKANGILDTDVGDNLLNDLGDLAYAYEVFLQAEAVYKDAKIVGIDQPNLNALNQRLNDYQPQLANHAIDLLGEALKHTTVLKADLAKLKNQPGLPTRHMNVDNMAKHLAKEYNNDIAKCCLQSLEKIGALLSFANDERYQAVRSLIKTSSQDYAYILETDDAETVYAAKINAAREILQP